MSDSKMIYKNGKRLRCGYTTGSCAAAAAKAASLMLFLGRTIGTIDIDTPKGIKLKLAVNRPSVNDEYACCFIIKDAGDDPDITDGIEIHAKAKKANGNDVIVKAGEGIGVVTRAGLPVSIGDHAINPTPMEMIRKEVKEVIPEGAGVEIEFSVPRGEEIAKRTYNPKLGIIGGISIIGTSGIVEPMSEDAIKDTIALELKVYMASGNDKAVLVPGNYGEAVCRNLLNVSGEKVVKVSNYLGFALEKCSEIGIKKIILAGHIGKLVKVAGGNFYTHSRICDTRMEILTAYLGIMGASKDMLIKIMGCKTAQEAIFVIKGSGFEGIYDVIAERCAARCEEYTYNSVEAGVYVFSAEKLLAKSLKADAILEELV